MKKVEYIITKEETLENFLNNFKIAKSKIYKLNINKCFLLNGENINLNTVLKENDILEIDFSIMGSNVQLWNKTVDIVYEDDDVIVVNKERGMLVHSDGDNSHTLTSALNYYLDKRNELITLSSINRIDVDTEGLVLFSKHPLANAFLDNEMAKGNIKKQYLAVVTGKVLPVEDTISYPIGKDRHESNKYLVSKSGKEAITKYKVLKTKNNKSLVEIDLLTGRTHQIRVHFSYLKHPLIGDKIYNKNYNNEPLMLLAKRISFTHPRSFKEMIVEIKNTQEFNI